MLQALSISRPERDSGTLLPEHLQTAVDMIRRDGFVALLDVVDTAHVDAVYQQMVLDIEAWNAMSAEPVLGGNFTPSRKPGLLFRDILMNPLIAQVLGELMGKEVSCGMYASNVTLPGLGDQELHVDMKPHEVGADLSTPCVTVVVNFPLVDFTVENGATEIWPGTHRVMREPGEFTVSRRLQDARREVSPPVRAVLPRGSALIRDMRLWHRGTTNHCDYLRPMAALILNGGYRPGVAPVDRIASLGPLPRESEPLFREDPVIYYNADFVDGEITPCPGQVAHVAS